MLPTPRADLKPNTVEFETIPLVKATGFREYDARWLLGSELNLLGLEALGLGLGAYFQERGERRVVVGHDFRSYSLSVKQALSLGLVASGCEVLDIGLALSPMAYFAQFDLEAPCVAMVTASHNENGWTGVKMGAEPPLTFGPDEIGRVKELVLGGEAQAEARRHRSPMSRACASATSPTPPRAAAHPPAEGGLRLRQRHRRRLRPRRPAPDGRRGDRDGLRPRLDLPALQSEPRRLRRCCTRWRRRCASTAPTCASASTATATAAAWSTTPARRSTPTRSA